MAEENVNTAQGAQNSAETTGAENTNANSDAQANGAQGAQNESQTENKTIDIENLIQKAVDRATNKLGNENKKLREQLETIKKDHLSADKIKEIDLANKEADIADREAKLAEKENRLFAIKAIKEAGLDDGGSNALELVEFVMGDSEEKTTARVKTFADLVKKFVAAEVNQTFRSNGRNPGKGESGESTGQNNIAVTIGKTVADRNAAANNVLNHYLGGNK